MSSLAILVYVLAVAVPALLLYCYKSQAWYWHVLAIAVAVGLGLTPMSASFKTPLIDLMLGGVFVALIFWGLGGLIIYRPHPTPHPHQR